MQTKLTTSLVVALLALSVIGTGLKAQSVTITNFTTDYFNTNEGWTRNAGLQGQNTTDPVGDRWQGNDPYNAGTTYGETDVVLYYVGYTPGASGLGNSSLLQGGMYSFDDIFPGTDNVRLWRSFTAADNPSLINQQVTFFSEWSLIGSLDPGFPNLDVFAFDLRTAGDADSVLRLQLTPGINLQANSYTLQAITDGGTSTLIDLAYQALWQVRVDMYGSNYDLQITQISPSTRAVIANFSLVSGGLLSGGYTALDFATLALDWELDSNLNTEPGSNFIVVNDFTVTTSAEVIPEPGTWAFGALLLGGLAARIWRTRRSGSRHVPA
jgi:hypothetical protein